MLDVARLARSLREAAHRVFDGRTAYASDEEAITATLSLLETHLLHGRTVYASWTTRLADYLGQLEERLSLTRRSPELAAALRTLRGQLLSADPASKDEIDAAERRLLSEWGSLSARLNGDPALTDTERQVLARELLEAEQLRCEGRMGTGLQRDATQHARITASKLEAYLVDRFDDPSIRVKAFQPLPGGYGKETILFRTEGRAFSGDYVMRRDRDTPTVDNDCHRITKEAPVIRAAFTNGFPVPEVMWCDAVHELLPGGDFLIMKKAPGKGGGNVFGAAGMVQDSLQSVLATCVGKLHALPQQRELGFISDGIKPDLWDMTLQQVTTRYITAYRDLYIAEMIEPTPAVLGMFGYLLSNVPAAPGKPVLLHGDIGFHNLILDDGNLSAVIDWEFAHIGDPAEDIGYIANTVGNSLHWDRFIASYMQAGGAQIDKERLLFFRVWGHLRNLAACQLSTNAYDLGRLDDLRIAHVGHSMTPMFLNAIRDVMDAPPG